MSMSANYKVSITLNGAWTADTRALLNAAILWWCDNHHSGLDFLTEWDVLGTETEYGPFFGLTYGCVAFDLEDAVNGEEEGELAKRKDFDPDVNQKLLEVMHTEHLTITFAENTGFVEGMDYGDTDEEELWSYEPDLCELSSDGTTFVISG